MKRIRSRKNVNNSSRRRKNNCLDLVDSISALPDSILGLILSLLPTKEAVSTTFLSKRWKFVWRNNVHNLDFRFDDSKNSYWLGDERMKFFVDRVLLLHDIRLLNKFRLDWNPDCISSSHVNSWINTAVTRNIHELYLCNMSPDCHSEFDLPTSVFSCESLRSLEFNGIYVPDVDVVCLPRLESLKLVHSGFISEEDFEKLISRCPVLNYLLLDMSVHSDYLIDDGISNEFTYVISSTSLKHLVLSFENDEPDESYNHSLKLKASSLEYLKLQGFISGISVQKSLYSLIEVDFGIDLFENEFPLEETCNSIVEAINAFDCVKVLTLSADAMWALSCATISLSIKFRRLTKLVTTTYCCYRSSLQDLIENSDNLEVLTIYQLENHQDRDYHDHLTWTKPVEVPRCLSNSLKKVEFHCYYEYDGARNMIRYMLKHGSALEVVKIFCRGYCLDKEKSEWVQEMCKFPKMSPVCKVEFL